MRYLKKSWEQTMNDFTKEELLELIGWADYCVGSSLCYTETEPLYKKIQSMIDNYCEHDYNEKSVELHAKQCCKCQKVKVL